MQLAQKLAVGAIRLMLSFLTVRAISHDVNEDLWPQRVADKFHQSSRALPKHIASDVFQTLLPPATRRMLQDALLSPSSTLALEDVQDTYTEDARPVTNVVDSVLSSCGWRRWLILSAGGSGKQGSAGHR